MWPVRNANGLLCCLAYYTVLLSSSSITLNTALLPLGSAGLISTWLWLPLYATLVCLSAFSHFQCMTTDPGFLPPNSIPAGFQSSSRICSKCNCLKTMRAHHCSLCHKCILKMDHHCPWVNNCIGVRTAKLYLLFLIYLLVSCWLSVGLLGLKVGGCYWSYGELCEAGRDWRVFWGFYAGFMCFTFGVFLGFLLKDQARHIITGTTAIEDLQKIAYSQVTFP